MPQLHLIGDVLTKSPVQRKIVVIQLLYLLTSDTQNAWLSSKPFQSNWVLRLMSSFE